MTSSETPIVEAKQPSSADVELGVRFALIRVASILPPTRILALALKAEADHERYFADHESSVYACVAQELREMWLWRVACEVSR